MTTKDYICTFFGMYDGTSKKIDDICENFYVDFGDDEMESLMAMLNGREGSYRNLGNMIISGLYGQIIDNAVEQLSPWIDRDKFDMNVNDFCSHLYYDGETLNNWDDIERIADRLCRE